MRPGKFFFTVLVLIVASSNYAQKLAPVKSGSDSVTWKIDNLKTIGSHQVTRTGKPQIMNLPKGQAVWFNGVDEGLWVNTNPVSGMNSFTVEAVFRPDAGGSAEQRWFHIQEESGDNRVLLETRLVGNQWFLDTFIKSGATGHALFAENFKHPVGEWYHVALVYDGTTMRHYVNGQEELSAPLTIDRPLAGGQTSIGVRQNRVFWFKGAISKARFTPRALLPNEFMEKK
jgi:hypothetical protein